jgi:hypothetical protein
LGPGGPQGCGEAHDDIEQQPTSYARNRRACRPAGGDRRYGSPDVLEVTDADPPAIGDHDVLVACGPLR